MVGIGSYFIGSFIMGLFGTVSEAIIIIFCIEENANLLYTSRCPQVSIYSMTSLANNNKFYVHFLKELSDIID